MVGMDMGFQRVEELQAQFLDQGRVAPYLLEDSVDEHGLTAFAAGQQIGVGRGLRVEQLPEDESHGANAPSPNNLSSTVI